MNKFGFGTEQEANDYKLKHKLFNRVAEPISGGKWGLAFPILSHLQVNDGAPAGMRRQPVKVSNFDEHSKERCRMDDLVGDEFQILAFRELAVTHQLAIAHYLSVDCGSWKCFFEQDRALLQDYVHEYGDELFGVVDIPSQRVTQSIMADPELATNHQNWDEYSAWYYAAGAVPEHGPDNRWPVLLSQDNDETLRDGWHRLHSYMRSGCCVVPAVFFPAERHFKMVRSKSAVPSVPLGMQVDSPTPGM